MSAGARAGASDVPPIEAAHVHIRRGHLVRDHNARLHLRLLLPHPPLAALRQLPISQPALPGARVSARARRRLLLSAHSQNSHSTQQIQSDHRRQRTQPSRVTHHILPSHTLILYKLKNI